MNDADSVLFNGGAKFSTDVIHLGDEYHKDGIYFHNSTLFALSSLLASFS